MAEGSATVKSTMSKGNDEWNSATSSQTSNVIYDRFTSLQDVRQAIKNEGVDECGLIFGIDYSLSNVSQGKNTFNGKSLHAIQEGILNPYQEIICALGDVLGDFNSNGVISAYGFGDKKVQGKGIFPLQGNGQFQSFGQVLRAYKEVTPNIAFGGPTNFAPLINDAVDIVIEHQQFIILVIVADGQVVNEDDTIQAIVDASDYPLSIIMIGVGDGPWEMMTDYDYKLPQRQFDNFQFVDFHEVQKDTRNPQAAIALAALMEIPDQYKKMKDLNMIK